MLIYMNKYLRRLRRSPAPPPFCSYGPLCLTCLFCLLCLCCFISACMQSHERISNEPACNGRGITSRIFICFACLSGQVLDIPNRPFWRGSWGHVGLQNRSWRAMLGSKSVLESLLGGSGGHLGPSWTALGGILAQVSSKSQKSTKNGANLEAKMSQHGSQNPAKIVSKAI